jgi:hypothetical protein
LTIRVVQWTTGRVAGAAVRAVLAHPELELVGCYVWTAEKAGKDVGELVNLPPLGITTTHDIDEIIALKPDVVLYMPLLWSVDDMVRLLEGGINLISTANFITGCSYGDADMNRLHDAAKHGGVSLYGSGINPGVAGAVALTSASACREIKRISIHEAADVSVYESKETWESLGFGQPPGDGAALGVVKERQLVFQDAIEMMAAALKVDLDEVSYTAEFGVAAEDIDLGWMQLPKGTVCGLRGMWQGIVDGRPLLEIGLTWQLGSPMEPSWPIEEGYVMDIDAVPHIKVRYEMDHSTDPDENDAMSDTANPAVNAIPAVVAAAPGLVTVADLPLITAGSIHQPG